MSLKKLLFTAAVLCTSASRADHVIPAGLAEEAKIGTGYESHEEKFVGSCLKGNYEEYGQQKANINFTQTISQSEMSKELGIDGSGRFKYGAATIGMSAKFLKSTEESAYSIIAIYSGDYKFKSLLYTLPKQIPAAKDSKVKGHELLKDLLTQTGEAVYDDDLRWRETCGDEFVAQIDRGAKLFYSIRIDFSSKEEKDLFETNFSYDSSYASVQAHLKNEVNKFSKNSQITVGAMQIGGDVSKITGLFQGETGDDAAMGFVKCNSGQFADCDKVMANAIQYATKDFPEQLKYDVNKNDGQGPAYLNYTTKPYSTVGIYPKHSPILAQVVVAKRRMINNLFDRQLAQLHQTDFLLNSPTIIRSPKQKQALRKVYDALTKNIETIVDVAEVCYNEYEECEATADPILAGAGAIEDFPEETFVLNPEIFRQFCVLGTSAAAPPELAPSIKGMIAAAKELEPNAFEMVDGREPDACLISDMVFSRNTVITTFKNKGITKLQPLAAYTHFVVVDLSDNKIQDVRDLAKWTALEELSLHSNQIRDLEGITQLSLLTKLRVSNNQLRSIDELVNLPNLKRVDARNNYSEVTCDNLPQVETCLKASVKTDANFSPIYTHTIVPLFLPSVARINDNEFFMAGMGTIGSIYSADTNSYRPTAPMENYSSGANVVALKNGNILISGGWQAGDQLYEFNPATGEMLKIPGGLKVPRVDHMTTVLDDGRVLITGGWEHSFAWTGTDPTYTAEIYDPETKSTSILPKMNAPRAWHTSTLMENGTVLIIGGFTNASSYATAEVFDPKTGKFMILGKSMSEQRGGHSATRLDDGSVLIVGGFKNAKDVVNTAEIYNPASARFEKIPEPLNYARAQHSALLLKNGKVLITGGTTDLYTPDAPIDGIAKSNILATAELYDPAENSFAQIPSEMFVPRMRHAMVETKPGSVLIVGGIDSISAKNSEVFTYTDSEVSLLP